MKSLFPKERSDEGSPEIAEFLRCAQEEELRGS